jgi:hypothetical protein
MAESKKKSGSRSKAKSPKPTERKLPTADETSKWIGRRVDGMGERSLGRVVGIHLDATDSQPRWAVIKLGPLAGTTGIPVEHLAAGGPKRLFAAYPRDLIKDAVRFSPDEDLTAADERELCESLEIPPDTGRAAELERRRDKTVTAKPLVLADPEGDAERR